MYQIEIKDAHGNVVSTLEVDWPEDEPTSLVRLISDVVDNANGESFDDCDDDLTFDDYDSDYTEDFDGNVEEI